MQLGNVATGASLAGNVGATPPAQSELAKRIASSVILIPLALASAALGGLPFAIVVTAFGVAALWEWLDMTMPARFLWLRLGALACLPCALIPLAFARPGALVPFLVLPAAAALVAGLAYPPMRWIGPGLVYVTIPCAAFILLRDAEPAGWAAILYLFVVVWGTDIAAYFGGRRFGGPKLWPRVSPKKTWSGALTGALAACVLGGAVVWLTGTGRPAIAMAVAALLSVASQAGDLFESALKRRFGVKDSGRLIPGHGGVLDRLDGLFAAAALAWLIAATGYAGNVLSVPRGLMGDAY